MIPLNKALIVVCMVSLLVACASPSGPPFQLQPAVAGKVTLYSFRTASIVGGGNSDIVAVNDRFIGRLNSGTYAVYETDPGSIRMSRKGGSIFFGEGEELGWGLGAFVGAVDGYIEVLNFNAEPGQIVFIRFPHGELVPNPDALGMMDGLENVTPSPE